MAKRRRRTKVQRLVNWIKKVLAFLFSNVGLFAIVVGYDLLGAVTFRAVESPHEAEVQHKVGASRRSSARFLWNSTFRYNILDEVNWKAQVRKQVLDFKDVVVESVIDGYDGKDLGVSAQWTFTGAFLYSLTVITTIGYGNISCKTPFGKTITIMYAIVGIPLMLLFLTNTGDVLAKSFRFLYKKTIRWKMNVVIWRKRRKQSEFRKRSRMAEAKASGLSKEFRGRPVTVSLLRSGVASAHESFIMGASSSAEEAGGVDEVMSARLAELEQISLKESVEEKLNRVSIPLSVVLLTMIAYLLLGSLLFSLWERWGFFDAFYFCYISLTTIGFGDLFPGASVKDSADAQEKLVICSLYLLLGMALIAMCFNLAQEEVVNKVSAIASRLGIFSDDEEDDGYS